jgi:uncharacterized protein CbrC (UPF0167 family)
MSDATPPVFRYYRDPYGDGTFQQSDEPCERCGRKTGYSYNGVLYAEEEVENLCPWCVADGSAAEEFDGTFVDDVGLEGCSPEAVAELTQRTPEFSSFQSAKWLVHCQEPAVYLGTAGYAELQTYGEATIRAVRDQLPSDMSEADQDAFVRRLHRQGSCVAHVFECLHCQAVVAYGECD